MDLALGVPALVVASPLIAYAAVRIKRDSPGPVFYRQRRAGIDGKPFDFLKLRTMSDDAEDRLEEVAGLSLHGGGISLWRLQGGGGSADHQGWREPCAGARSMSCRSSGTSSGAT